MAIRNLEEAFVHELKDILYAEKQITKALPKMARQARSAELRQAFEEHLAQTNQQIERLEQVFAALGKPARAQKCEGIVGIIAEGEELLQDEDVAEAVLDALLIGVAQRVEHYEIAAYGTLCAWGEQLGLDAAALLRETLAEEQQTDERLTQLAESLVNAQAADEDEADPGEEEEEAEAEAEDDADFEDDEEDAEDDDAGLEAEALVEGSEDDSGAAARRQRGRRGR